MSKLHTATLIIAQGIHVILQ